jgi:ribosomal protein S24E
MEMHVESERENPFFKRKDLMLKLSHGAAATPKKADLAKELASKYGVDQSQVEVVYVTTGKGETESEAKVRILNEKPAPKEDKSKAAPSADGAATAEAPKAEEKKE